MLIPNTSRDSCAYPELIKGKAAKVSKGRSQSPLVASAEAKPSVPTAKCLKEQNSMNSVYRQVFLLGKSNPNMYFSTGRKVPKAHRGGQSVYEGGGRPGPPYPNCLSAHPRGAALRTPRRGGVSGLGEALARHHIQHASSTGSLAWESWPKVGDYAFVPDGGS